jgi:hypothetical protein
MLYPLSYGAIHFVFRGCKGKRRAVKFPNRILFFHKIYPGKARAGCFSGLDPFDVQVGPDVGQPISARAVAAFLRMAS